MSADIRPPSGLSSRHVLALGLLAAVVALTGCSLVFGHAGGLPSGDTAADSYLSLDGYSAVAHIERTGHPERRVRIDVDPDGRNSRSKALAPPSDAGNVYVTNGSSLVRYNATRNEYVRISTTGNNPFELGSQRIARAVAAAHEEGTTTSAPAIGGAPLPSVPEQRTDSDEPARQFTVSYEGTRTYRGRQAYVITYEAAGERSGGLLNQTVLLDSEYFITLKATAFTRFEGNVTTYRFHLTNLTFDPGFEQGHFRFDPPADATQNESRSFDQTGYDSRADLQAAVDMRVPDPAVPDRFDLVRADHIVGGEFTAVQLRYRSSSSTLFVTKTTEDGYANLTSVETVSIGGRTGKYSASSTRALVAWQCGDTTYTVVGSLRKSVLVDIARSVGCQ